MTFTYLTGGALALLTLVGLWSFATALWWVIDANDNPKRWEGVDLKAYFVLRFVVACVVAVGMTGIVTTTELISSETAFARIPAVSNFTSLATVSRLFPRNEFIKQSEFDQAWEKGEKHVAYGTPVKASFLMPARYISQADSRQIIELECEFAVELPGSLESRFRYVKNACGNDLRFISHRTLFDREHFDSYVRALIKEFFREKGAELANLYNSDAPGRQRAFESLAYDFLAAKLDEAGIKLKSATYKTGV